MDFLFYQITPQRQGSSIQPRSRTAVPWKNALRAPSVRSAPQAWLHLRLHFSERSGDGSALQVPPKEGNCTSSLENLSCDLQSSQSGELELLLFSKRQKQGFVLFCYFTLSGTLDNFVIFLTTRTACNSNSLLGCMSNVSYVWTVSALGAVALRGCHTET